MTGLLTLLLPIVVSAVFVFVVSSIVHMLSPWHKNDFPKMPNEEKVAEALRPFAIPPGDYMMPKPDSTKDLSSPEFLAKMEKGPVLSMTVLPNGRVNMGKNLIMWFLYSIVISIFAAYISGRALSPGAHYLQVFRFAGATAFLGYSAALWQMSIWYSRSWKITLKATIDGLLYALVTAGVFGWLWPSL